jgi:hypothetical protein
MTGAQHGAARVSDLRSRSRSMLRHTLPLLADFAIALAEFVA